MDFNRRDEMISPFSAATDFSFPKPCIAIPASLEYNVARRTAGVKKSSRFALGAMLLYCILAGLWVLLSDRALAIFITDPAQLSRLQTWKGLAFIGITAVLFFVMLRNQFWRWEKEAEERKQTETALRAKEEKLRAIFAAEPECLKLIEPDGTLHEINPAGLRMIEADNAGLVIGKTLLPVVAPEHRETVLAALAAAARGESRHLEFKITGFKGTQRWLELSAAPIRDPASGRQMILAVSRDITERKRAEDELRESSEKFHQLANNITDVFWMRSPDFRDVIYVSPAFEKVWGRPVEELYAHPERWVEFIFPDDRERVTAAFDKLQKDGPGLDIEYRIVWPNGDIRWIRARGFQVRDAQGRIIRYIGIITDVTERRKLEEQFRQAQKMEAIGQLAGGVAHDFNNILAVIQLQAGLLKGDQTLPRQPRDLAGEIEKATHSAANLIRQLLLFSRKQALQLRDIDLNEVISDLAKMLQRVLGEPIEMQLELEPEPLIIHADAGIMDQVLMNLTVNARDAMPKGGRLIIETSAVSFDDISAAQTPSARPGSFACLSVTDTGCGIPQEILPRIFEPFFTTKDVGKGTGLGLATVFGIVQQHQGWITVQSEVGRGTTFRVYLPRLTKPSSPNAIWSSLASIRGGNENILLVEDDAPLRRSVRTALSRLGYHLFEAASGPEALEIWKRHGSRIDLLLTDIVMPGGINGKELAEQLLQSNPELKVIYASGYNPETSENFQLEDGVNFLIKPFEAHKLALIVRNCLDRRRR